MKIKKIECTPVSIAYKKDHKLSGSVGKEARSVVIRIYTDEGIVGVADSGGTWEWYLGDTQDSMMGIIRELFGPGILLGADPLKIENIVARMDRAARGNYQAKALVDFALHDIKGKKLGVPIYELLGGLSNEKIACGYVMSSETSTEMAHEAVRLVNAGFHSLKIKVAFRSPEEDLENVRAVREAVGDKVKLMIDANGGWNYYQALLALGKMEKYDIAMVEQPVPWWDIDGMARLRKKTRIPVFPDESATELMDLLEIIRKEAADGIFLKVVKAGGLVKSLKFISIAEAAGLPVMCGCMVGGGLEAAAQAHLLAASNWAGKLEHENIGPLVMHDLTDTVGVNVENDIAKTLPRYENGFMYPPTEPGIGIEVNERVLSDLITPGKRPVVVE